MKGLLDRRIFEPEHDDFRSAVREFAAKELAAQLERYRSERVIDRAAWRKAGDLGFLGFMIPESYGGGGVDDFRFNAVLGEELARVSVGVASCFGLNTDVIAPYLLELTDDAQKERWLPGFAAGELVTSIGMSEPGAGSDLAALRTTATPDGSDWILRGSKTFITNGYTADLVVVAARTSDDRKGGITLFVVEAGMPGFERGTKLDKIGQSESDTAELFFNDVRLPASSVLGEVGGGFPAMMARLPQERLSIAVLCAAHATTMLELALTYAKDRHAFGRPIGSFQHNRFVLAELATELDLVQGFVDRCIEEHVAGRLSPVTAAKAKYAASELQNRVVDTGVQLFGGYGYMREYPIAQAWVDARVTRIWGGTNEIMREVIGRDLGV